MFLHQQGLFIHYAKNDFCGSHPASGGAGMQPSRKVCDVENAGTRHGATNAMDDTENEDDVFGIPDDDVDEQQMDDDAPGVEYQSAITGVDDQNIVQFVLMQLLSYIRAPCYTYGKVKKWCLLAQSRKFKFAGMQSQGQAFSQLEHLFAMAELRPVLREATVRVLKSGCVTADILDQVSEEIAEGHPIIQEVSRGGDESSVDESLEDDSSLSSIEDTDESPFIDEGHKLITTRTIKGGVHPYQGSPDSYVAESSLIVTTQQSCGQCAAW